jgi:hypothetical protein
MRSKPLASPCSIGYIHMLTMWGRIPHLISDNIAGYRLEIFTIQELLQSVTPLTRCPRLGYRPRPRSERLAFAECYVGRLGVRARKRRSEECLFESEGP